MYNTSVDISVEAEECEDGEIRLASYTDNHVQFTRHGALQICINRAWGGVCSDIYFGDTEMAVVCREMGFSNKGM